MDDIFYPVAHRSDEELAALATRYGTFPERDIPRLIRSSVNMTAVSWKKPESWSTSHVLYIVTVAERSRPIVLRANIGWGKPERYMLVEKLVTDQVAVLGVPVNRILYADISRSQFPFDYQIQDMLEGSDIEGHFHGTRDAYDQLSYDLGRYVAMWGDLSFSQFGRFDADAAEQGQLKGTKQSMYEYVIVRLDDDLRYLVDAGVLTVLRADAVRTVFETHKSILSVPIGTLVQYDLADHNIMFDGNTVITGVFDWEAAIVGDPMLDLASAPTWKTQYPREKKLLEGYTSVRPLPNFWKEKMHLYRLRTMLWKMVFAIRTGILTDDRKRKFDAALVPFRI